LLKFVISWKNALGSAVKGVVLDMGDLLKYYVVEGSRVDLFAIDC